MSGKVVIEFDDSQARSIESLAASLDLTPGEVSQLFASLAADLSEAISRMPREKLVEFRAASARLANRSNLGAGGLAELLEQVFAGNLRNPTGESEAVSELHEASNVVDDGELSKISDSLMIRKAELYRRLAR